MAIAPALFHRQAPNFAVGYSPEELEQAVNYAGNTTATQLLNDIQGAINYLKTSPQVQQRFGCVGFCFGGHVAYLAATCQILKSQRPSMAEALAPLHRAVARLRFSAQQKSPAKFCSALATKIAQFHQNTLPKFVKP